jgi:hypothetical protein
MAFSYEVTIQVIFQMCVFWHLCFIGAKLLIDGVEVTESYMRQSTMSSTGYVQLDSKPIHTITVDFFSFENSVRTLSIWWQPPTATVFTSFEEWYYSLNGMILKH